jgi:hypothetical protein
MPGTYALVYEDRNMSCMLDREKCHCRTKQDVREWGT